MKKNYSNKELKGEEKKADVVRLICIRECVVPDFGHWVAGDVVKDSMIVGKLAGNPNFKEMEG